MKLLTIIAVIIGQLAGSYPCCLSQSLRGSAGASTLPRQHTKNDSASLNPSQHCVCCGCCADSPLSFAGADDATPTNTEPTPGKNPPLGTPGCPLCGFVFITVLDYSATAWENLSQGSFVPLFWWSWLNIPQVCPTAPTSFIGCRSVPLMTTYSKLFEHHVLRC